MDIKKHITQIYYLWVINIDQKDCWHNYKERQCYRDCLQSMKLCHLILDYNTNYLTLIDNTKIENTFNLGARA